jgi:hypothetical protein
MGISPRLRELNTLSDYLVSDVGLAAESADRSQHRRGVYRRGRPRSPQRLRPSRQLDRQHRFRGTAQHQSAVSNANRCFAENYISYSPQLGTTTYIDNTAYSSYNSVQGTVTLGRIGNHLSGQLQHHQGSGAAGKRLQRFPKHASGLHR